MVQILRKCVFFQRQMFVCSAGVKATIVANMLPIPIQMRLCTEAALKKHMESHHFRFGHDSSTESHSQTINAQKSFRECEQNSGKALKPNKICPHQIQLYHFSICEKVLGASKNVHKQFINSGACENWCYGWKCSMETRS